MRRLLLAGVLLALLGGVAVARQPFPTDIQVAINQLVTGVVPFTAFRTAASSYLNWGTTQGTGGYGFRDNAGVIEAKNSGGSWLALPTSSTLPTAASFITRVAEVNLSNETALGALATGILINTTTTGLPAIYAGSGACAANQYVTTISAIGATTCGTVAATGLTGTLPVASGGTGLATGTSGGVLAYTAAGTLASSAALTQYQLVIGGGAGAAPGPLGSHGTTTTVLHGNPSGPPTFGAVSLANDITGTLGASNGGTANAFFSVSGPATSVKTFTFPNVSATILTTNAAVTAAQGGTGLTSYTTGMILHATGAATLAGLADVATGNVLLSGGVGAVPTYGKVGLSTHVSGSLAVANGGTGLASYAVGDLIYASGATTLAPLADVAAGSYLRSGGVTTAPLWSTLILPNAASQGQLPVASAANTLTMLAVGTAGQLLRSAGAGATVTWSTAVFPNTATTGDLITASGANTYANLATGAAGTVLIGGATPSYSATPAVTSWSAVSFAALAAATTNTVYTLASTATSDDPTETFAQYRIATTDATVTQIVLQAVPATTTLQYHCAITARRTGGVAGAAEDGAAYLLQVAYKNVAGNATEIAAETLTVVGEDQAAWTVTAAPSGANAAISVTGAVDNTVTWHASCRTYRVSS